MIILLSVVIVMLLLLMGWKHRAGKTLIENMKQDALLNMDRTYKAAHDEGYREGIKFISRGTIEMHRNQMTGKNELIKNLTEELQRCNHLIEEYRKKQ